MRGPSPDALPWGVMGQMRGTQATQGPFSGLHPRAASVRHPKAAHPEPETSPRKRCGAVKPTEPRGSREGSGVAGRPWANPQHHPSPQAPGCLSQEGGEEPGAAGGPWNLWVGSRGGGGLCPPGPFPCAAPVTSFRRLSAGGLEYVEGNTIAMWCVCTRVWGGEGEERAGRRRNKGEDLSLHPVCPPTQGETSQASWSSSAPPPPSRKPPLPPKVLGKG